MIDFLPSLNEPAPPPPPPCFYSFYPPLQHVHAHTIIPGGPIKLVVLPLAATPCERSGLLCGSANTGGSARLAAAGQSRRRDRLFHRPGEGKKERVGGWGVEKEKAITAQSKGK